MNAPSGRTTAIVIGAGIAGLAVARVLAGRFSEVSVVDRDDLPDHPGPRRGVPQGQHSHVLLVAGQRALEDIFPGLHDDLVAAGAVVFDSGQDLHLFRLGAAWNPVRSGLPFVSLSRPLLEYTMRRLVQQLAAQVSGAVRTVVLEVQHLLTPPLALWRPELVAEVARAARHAGDGEEPAFGYGTFDRPLWTDDDAHAERIRAALRAAGFAEFTHEQGGFAVEGSAPILIAGLDGRAPEYVGTIASAGYVVEPDADDPLLLRAVPA
ncbi:MAG TPA: hypothetical protein VND92_06045 [Vicinamibacterales bacterium]|nr:hypothetical protein [Vicinamibacterales bacterium]